MAKITKASFFVSVWLCLLTKYYSLSGSIHHILVLVAIRCHAPRVPDDFYDANGCGLSLLCEVLAIMMRMVVGSVYIYIYYGCRNVYSPFMQVLQFQNSQNALLEPLYTSPYLPGSLPCVHPRSPLHQPARASTLRLGRALARSPSAAPACALPHAGDCSLHATLVDAARAGRSRRGRFPTRGPMRAAGRGRRCVDLQSPLTQPPPAPPPQARPHPPRSSALPRRPLVRSPACPRRPLVRRLVHATVPPV